MHLFNETKHQISKRNNMTRINFLDGLRGVAILLVVSFHAYCRWPQKYPYGSGAVNFPIVKFGNLGVQLFFLISGFVILMSLEKENNFLHFIYKRWLRLFPAMLIATILVFVTAPLLYERPGGIPNLRDILPGLFFIEPDWLSKVSGVAINPLEGAFWSLFVEFKFYFLFGLLYFLLGEIKAIAGLFLFFIIGLLSSIYEIKYLNSLSSQLSFIYFGWFASGALAYLYFTKKNLNYIILSVCICALQILDYNFILERFIFMIVLLLAFFIPICFENTRKFLTNKVFLFFGLISYPLYLIHESAMVAMIIKLHKSCKDFPLYFLPIFPIAILSAVAYFIVKKPEPFIGKTIRTLKSKLLPVAN